MTTVFLIRHAEKSKNLCYLYDENFLLKDEKRTLSIIGQKQAENLSKLPFLQDIDIIFSSHYVRTILTASYLADRLGKEIYITKDFGERIKSRTSYKYLPKNFRILQLKDENYKLENGESRKEVFERFYNTLLNIIIKYKDKKIAIFSHKNAITMLLMHWCQNTVTDKIKCCFNDKIILNGTWDGTPEIIKVEFDNNKLVNIDKIKN